MIAAPKMAVRRSCDVTVGSYLVGDTVSGDRSIQMQLARGWSESVVDLSRVLQLDVAVQLWSV